jgi:hypothetical protein
MKIIIPIPSPFFFLFILEQLLNRIETIIEDNHPVSKGTFAKFANIFKKYPEIVNTVGAILLKWLSSKN